MLVPHTSGRSLLALSQILVGGSVMLSAMLLLSGLYQIQVTVLRNSSIQIDLDVAFIIVTVVSGCVGLLTFSSLMRAYQAAKLWLSLALNLLSCVASVYLTLKLRYRSHCPDQQTVMACTVSVTLVLCLINSTSLLLLRSARPPQLPPSLLGRGHGGRIYQRQRHPMADYARHSEGPQHLAMPSSLLPPPQPPPPPPPPPYAVAAKPPAYSQSDV